MDLRILFGIVAACDDGMFEGLDECQSEYERRFTDGFGTVDGFGGGVFEEREGGFRVRESCRRSGFCRLRANGS